MCYDYIFTVTFVTILIFLLRLICYDSLLDTVTVLCYDRVMKNCEQCGEEFEAKSAKAKFCSDACKMAYSRRKKAGNVIEEPIATTKQEPDIKLSKTDQDFENSDPGYYMFSELEWKRTCILPECKKEFRTRLKLLKCCSTQHSNDLTTRLTGRKT